MALCSELEFEDEQADVLHHAPQVPQSHGPHLPLSSTLAGASNDENTPVHAHRGGAPALPAAPAVGFNGSQAQGTPLRSVQPTLGQQYPPTPFSLGSMSPASLIGQQHSTSSMLAARDDESIVKDKQYAIEACNRIGVPDEERPFIVDAAELPVKQLLITVLCKVSANQHDATDQAITTYLKGNKYKAHIKGRIEAMLLSGSIAAYKTDMTQRCIQHIREHPDLYRVPQKLVQAGILKTAAFETALSSTLTYIRAEIKRKLLSLWKNNTDIYHVVQKIGKASIVPSAPMWGRWAWVQLKLIDYQELVKRHEAKDEHFWDWIDTQLKERRDKYQHYTDQKKAEAISRIFELMLQKHIAMFPAQAPETQAMSSWQKDILRSLNELEKYSGQDLADAVRPDIINQENTIQSLNDAIHVEEREISEEQETSEQ